MRSVRVAVVGAMVISGLVGCRNRVADERDALWQQNREQQEALDRANRQAEEDARKRDLALQTPTAPPVAVPPPAPTPVAPPAPDPRSLEGIEGTETTANPDEGTVTVNLPGDIFFDSGAATIKSAARASLDKVAAALKRDYADKEVRVEGHTDSDPIRRSKWRDNQHLSEARAAAVRDYLVKKGVDAGAISTIGHGADMPRGQDKARNRRVEVVVVVDANAPNARRSSEPVAEPAVSDEGPDDNK